MKLAQGLLGIFLATQLSCSSPDVPKGIIPRIKDEKVNMAAGLETLDPKVDILFVIDDSGSMSSHQANLSQNIDKFVAGFFGKIQTNFHIGVITTSDDNSTRGPCCGHLAGSPTFVDKNTPNYQKLLQERMIVGTDGSATEKVFDPIVKALSEPNLSTFNKGFFRPGAYLAIVLITDAEDQSELFKGPDVYNYLVGLTGKAEKVLLYGVLVPSNVADVSVCPRDGAEPPDLIEKFLAMSVTTGKNSFSLCTPDFGDRLSEMGRDLAKRVGNSMPLARIPIPETIQVKFGTQIISPDPMTGWTYDPETNSIVFGSKVEWSEQAPDTQISVTYDFTEYKDSVN